MTCLDDDIVLGLVEGRLAAAILADVCGIGRCATHRDVVSIDAPLQVVS